MRPYTKLAVAAVLLAGLVLPGMAHSAVVVSDDFLYNEVTNPLGALGGFTLQDHAGGQNGAAGQWTGLWTVSGEATITGPDFAETDNQYQGIVGDLGIPVNLNYLQRTYQLNGLPNNQTLFFSVRSRIDLDVTNIPRLWIHSPLVQESEIAIGYDVNGVVAQLGMEWDASFGDPINDGEFHTLVGKLEIDAAGEAERMTVWLDPTGPEVAEETASIEANILGSINELDGVLRLGRRDEGCCGGKRVYWDDVALGTTWSDVAQVDVPRLRLEVNPNNGAATLVNDSGSSFDLNYYEIKSASGALNVVGWNSLDDQNASGGAWMENNPKSDQLIESNFRGVTSLANGQSLLVGSPFKVGGVQDLVARVGTAQGLLNLALVEYVTGLNGDYNGNGNLDAGDLDLQAAAMVAGGPKDPFDLNGDSAVNFADRKMWLHDLKKTWVGDSDLNGLFNSADFVLAFQAGKYEVAGATATWVQGDWNGDQRFTSDDFVAAFADGGYEVGPRPGAVSAVPEPGSISLLLLGLAGLLCVRRSSSP